MPISARVGWLAGLRAGRFALLAGLGWSTSLSGQWIACGSSGQCLTSGRVGIGTSSPAFELSVTGPTAGAATGSLQLNTTGGNSGQRSSLSMYATFANYPVDTIPRRTADILAGFNGGVWGNEYLSFHVGSTINGNITSNDGENVTQEKMRIQANGRVGIGTSDPQHALHVNGRIGATEVIVSSTGADYVFDPGYRLAPLSEVARFIEANHRLPDIPSAAEGAEKGVGVGEMQARLLAKIEELTLHMIEAEERNHRLEERNRELAARVTKLERNPGARARRTEK